MSRRRMVLATSAREAVVRSSMAPTMLASVYSWSQHLATDANGVELMCSSANEKRVETIRPSGEVTGGSETSATSRRGTAACPHLRRSAKRRADMAEATALMSPAAAMTAACMDVERYQG
ncbi:hypothetical protein JCM24511_02687 [Saitozyma sp. JCM 24511]|nr:hypothetical protein JCM24511_02687 [Saitozyma sp. JCM 24511]